MTTRRRRPGVLALALALIAAGGAGVVVLTVQAGHRTDVVSVVREVPVGQVLTRKDLGKASIALDPAVRTVDADALESVVGLRAAVELRPGSLLSRAQLTADSLIEPGRQLLPIGLKPEQVPATGLVPGQDVLLVHVPTPEDGGKSTADSIAGESVPARVVKTGSTAVGGQMTVVDVVTAEADGARVTAWAAAEQVRVILTAPGAAR